MPNQRQLKRQKREERKEKDKAKAAHNLASNAKLAAQEANERAANDPTAENIKHASQADQAADRADAQSVILQNNVEQLKKNHKEKIEAQAINQHNKREAKKKPIEKNQSSTFRNFLSTAFRTTSFTAIVGLLGMGAVKLGSLYVPALLPIAAMITPASVLVVGAAAIGTGVLFAGVSTLAAKAYNYFHSTKPAPVIPGVSPAVASLHRSLAREAEEKVADKNAAAKNPAEQPKTGIFACLFGSSKAATATPAAEQAAPAAEQAAPAAPSA